MTFYNMLSIIIFKKVSFEVTDCKILLMLAVQSLLILKAMVCNHNVKIASYL